MPHFLLSLNALTGPFLADRLNVDTARRVSLGLILS
jgi:hypothetical protein